MNYHTALLLLVLLVTGCQSTSTSDRERLYDALGEREGIETIVKTMLYRIVEDERLTPAFKGINVEQFHRRLSDQICEISNGPCNYSGRSMREAHEGMGVTETQFNAVVEHLVRAMEANGVGTAAQNRLLALLAPMHKDIVRE